MITFKDAVTASEYQYLHPMIKAIAEDFDLLSGFFDVKLPVATRVTAHIKGSSGVHELRRAIDFRYLGVYSEKDANTIVEMLNNKYLRKDTFKTAIIHSFQGGPMHFHLQAASSHEYYEDPQKWYNLYNVST
jgi:hypothetical protein